MNSNAGNEDVSTGLMILVVIVAAAAIVMLIYSSLRPETFTKDCQGEFSPWSPCEGPCDEVPKISRTYKITNPARDGGQVCPFQDGYIETQTCEGTITPCCEVTEDWARVSETCPSTGIIATSRTLRENKPGACASWPTTGEEMCCYQGDVWTAVGECSEFQPGYQKYQQVISSTCPADFAFKYEECRDCVGSYDISDDEFVCPTTCGYSQQTITKTWATDFEPIGTGRACPPASQSIDCTATPDCPCVGTYSPASCPTACDSPASSLVFSQTGRVDELNYSTCPSDTPCPATIACCDYDSAEYKHGTCGQYTTDRQMYRKNKSNAPCEGDDYEEYDSGLPCCVFQEMACSNYATEADCESPCVWNNGVCIDACAAITAEEECAAPCVWDETTLACTKPEPTAGYAQAEGVCTFDKTTEKYYQVYRKQKTNAPCESDVDYIDVTVQCAPCQGTWESSTPCVTACDTAETTEMKTWTTTTPAIGTGVCPDRTPCSTYTTQDDCDLWCTWNGEQCVIPSYTCPDTIDCCDYETEEDAVRAGHVSGVCTFDEETQTYFQTYIRQTTSSSPTPCEALPESELKFTRSCAPCVGEWKSPACTTAAGSPASTPSQVWVTSTPATGTGTCPTDANAPAAPTYNCSAVPAPCQGTWNIAACPTECGYAGGTRTFTESENYKEDGKVYAPCPTTETCPATTRCCTYTDWARSTNAKCTDGGQITLSRTKNNTPCLEDPDEAYDNKLTTDVPCQNCDAEWVADECPTECGFSASTPSKTLQINTPRDDYGYGTACPTGPAPTYSCPATDPCTCSGDWDITCPTGCGYEGGATQTWQQTGKIDGRNYETCPTDQTCPETPACDDDDRTGFLTLAAALVGGVAAYCEANPGACLPSVPCVGYVDGGDQDCPDRCGQSESTIKGKFKKVAGDDNCPYKNGEEVTIKKCPATPACCKYDTEYSAPAITGVPGVCNNKKILMQKNKRPASEQPAKCQNLPSSEITRYDPCQNCEGSWNMYASGFPSCVAGPSTDTTYTRTWTTTTPQDSNGYGASCPSPATQSTTCYKTCIYGWKSNMNCGTDGKHTETWSALNEPCTPSIMDS